MIDTDYYYVSAYYDESYTALSSAPTVSGNYYVLINAYDTSTNPWKGSYYAPMTVYDSESEDSGKTSMNGNVWASPEPIEVSLYDRSPATVTKGTDFNLYRVSDNALVKTSYYNVSAYCDSSYS